MERLSTRLLSWASLIDEKTLAQAYTTARMPFIHPHLALMPDAHLGKGATVGSVIPTLGAIIPAAVGVDIGCGMIAVRTRFTRSDLEGRDLAELREQIERAIPLSAGRYNNKVVATAEPRIAELEALAEKNGFDPAQYAGNWRLQLGTLGSGNHFIEVSVDELDRVWLFLHSGSRGVGNKIAMKHISVAQRLCKQWWIDLPDPDLAYLVEGTPEFTRYIRELRWAQHFALLNREEMMDRVIRQVSEFLGSTVDEQERINCHHNFTESEKHYGKQVWVSRKGAIQADAGRPGLIPGSMGTASYVVEGLGDPQSLNSSPHGAGREYSRSAARRTFTHDELREAMTGIEFRDTAAFIDEIPQAYKPIDQVMADAASLVSIRHTLRQLVNVKGD
ncbi:MULTISPECIES: RtcB family protein [unclassified Microbacterium]|uniref:RtcB family protein n=1 Tax=unclassified Microbacterium TaxID=2609290 RepID=UPI000CFD1A11|nr:MULTISPECIES: RtcB family protein [unclassified Microbacterium]PQZ53718.1 RNA-splicing ligase RtcB [Microbacterium sp. MYb43]PQZ76253.1 RNA-splicing ligase RtcB [Microbacterium sp. MYb40]PRB21365.1 RNA-splicing ligase RtcB [Microbacterium sp. MYb54]PRB29928.1 RNA-splicing ligase RtcB [Microbacterium sp. MYb50]PRB67911.1 RNA-splicing ligase RtcB [Microbacterium sp. MYb24]